MHRYLAAIALAFFPLSAYAAGAFSLEAEVANYDADTEVVGSELSGNGTMYGGTLTARLGESPMIALQGRALTGNLSHSWQSRDADNRAVLFEGRGLIGGPLSHGITAYTGGGYRYLDSEPDDGSSRVSHNLYVPVGLMATNRIGSTKWSAHTELEIGLIVWGQEDIEDLGVVNNETFARSSGFETRAAITFNRGPLFLTPFIRHFSQGDTEEKTISGSDVKVDRVDATEAGLRVGFGF